MGLVQSTDRLNTLIIVIFRRGRVGPLKAVVKLFTVRKIGAKLIFFQISTPRINDTRSRRRHTGEFFKEYLEEGGVVCIFFLSACCGKGDRNESTNVSIYEAYYRNKTKTF